METNRLLRAQDPDPVIVHNLDGASPFVLLGDHAGRETPARLERLGLKARDIGRHIAWDIGVAGLGEGLARRLDAPFMRQAYSRLVIDCNRDPGHPGSIVEVSDGTAIGANAGLSEAERRMRIAEVFRPYHARIEQLLDLRHTHGRGTLLVCLHSFTPAMGGQARPWWFGVLHRGDSAFSAAVIHTLRRRWSEALVGDNEPYAMDGTDYTAPHHADRLGLDYLELEIRQDLIDAPEKQAALVEPLAQVLEEAFAGL
ncbi:MAG: N-formylglutamate amidohydrolase [Caulobacteraceae bacterium]|nr:N-formylglutamate amidohydrolase [Caulobacteraceae bacterium]